MTKPDDGQSEERKLRSAYHSQAPDSDDDRGHDRQDDEYQDSQGVLDSHLLTVTYRQVTGAGAGGGDAPTLRIAIA